MRRTLGSPLRRVGVRLVCGRVARTEMWALCLWSQGVCGGAARCGSRNGRYSFSTNFAWTLYSSLIVRKSSAGSVSTAALSESMAALARISIVLLA